jgi:putative transcriptional regulator
LKGGGYMFERLRELRKAKGYTCEQMADKLGLKKAAYSKKELGKIKFSLSDAKKVSEILGYSIDDIFFARSISFKDTKSA